MDPVASIMALAYSMAGIALGPAKRAMVETRLAKRLRTLGIDMAAYARLVQTDDSERVQMLDLLTTNHTAWLREPDHFSDLEKRVLPAISARTPVGGRARVRMWCAAAASGEEPWTIAMCLHRWNPDADAQLLATDLSTRALAKAKAGKYDEQRVEALSPAERQLALELVEMGPPKVYQVNVALRRMVSFARLNLMTAWPMRGPFDVIFCRNVMIYFDNKTQERLVNRMAGLLALGGTLYVGHSESLSAIQHPLKSVRAATYVR